MDDDCYKKVDDEKYEEGKKKLNRLEKEEISYSKAHKKLVSVIIVSSFFVIV